MKVSILIYKILSPVLIHVFTFHIFYIIIYKYIYLSVLDIHGKEIKVKKMVNKCNKHFIQVGSKLAKNICSQIHLSTTTLKIVIIFNYFYLLSQ